MTINNKIIDEKLRYDIKREASKILSFSSGEINKYDSLTNEKMF